MCKRKGSLLVTTMGMVVLIGIATSILIPMKQQEILIIRDKRQYVEKQIHRLQAILCEQSIH